MMIDTARYTFIAEALQGNGGFLPRVSLDASGQAVSVARTHLVPYPRESTAKFARRNAVAWYENSLLPACQRFVGYLAKKPPLRDINHPLLGDFAADCNWRGDALDVFWQGFMVEAKARGMMFLIVDMPRGEPANAAEQVEQRFFPYLVPIAPERVANLSTDIRGLLSLFEYHDVDDSGDPVIRGWDAQRWWVRRGNDEIAGEDHRLGACPVLAFSEDGNIPCVGSFSQIADLSKRLFNARSELDEILRSQTFSLLTYHVPPEQTTPFNAKEAAEAIGTHNMLIHSGDTPAFIAPPDGPANTYLETIAHIEQAIARVALAIELPEKQGAESGIALTIRFQSLNSALTSFARRMEDLERRTWYLVSLWLGLGEVGGCQWQKDYALADLAAEMQTLADMIASGMPDAVIAQQKKAITQLAFPNLAQDDMQALLTAIDEGSQEVATGVADGTDGETTHSVLSSVASASPVIDVTPIANAIAAMKAPEITVNVPSASPAAPEKPVQQAPSAAIESLIEAVKQMTEQQHASIPGDELARMLAGASALSDLKDIAEKHGMSYAPQPVQASPSQVIQLNMPAGAFQIDNHINLPATAVSIEPAAVNVENIVNLPDAPAPNVTITNEVTPTPVTITNDVQPASVQLNLPPRKTETAVVRDDQGNIVRATQIESDLPEVA